jgi:hypothetical protein
MGHRPLSPASPARDKRWLDRLAQARSDAQLLKVCRRYLASMRGSGWAGLPLACRPRPLEDATDLSAYALQLVRHRCEADNPSPMAVRIAAFFVHANVRMAQILRQMNDAAEADIILARLGRAPTRDPGPEAPRSSGAPLPG